MTRHHLPTLDDRESATAYCAYCPKLCRHTCPVSTVEGRETTTPWGKMHIAHRANRSELPPHRSYVESSYACTGCMRCTTACDHDNNVAEVLLVARKEGGVHGALGGSVAELRLRHAARALKASQYGAEFETLVPSKASGSVIVLSCTSLATAKSDARAHAKVHATIAGSSSACSASSCCGLPLLEGGDMAGFARAAKKFWKRHAKAETLVFNDPGCQHALLRRAPELGIEPPKKQRHIDLLTYLDSHSSRVRPLVDAPAIYYKDPCRLGRGLGVYQAPRRLIERITQKKTLEFDYSQAEAVCSGAGGQLPVTFPDTARAIANELAAPAAGAWIATGCPASKRQLQESGALCVDLGALAAMAIFAHGEKLPWSP